MFQIKSVKSQLILFLISFTVYLGITEKSALLLIPLLLCVVTAALLDACLLYIKKRQFFYPESAVITGLIIGLVLSGEQAWYIYIAASALAITSKHIIRIHNKHLFNPAAFGILVSMLFLSATTQWNGTYQRYILIPFGLYFIYRIGKMPLLLSYAVTALSIWGVQALMQHVKLITIFGYLSYFFIFIMLIEPKTTPITKAGKIVFGVIVAVSIFIFTESGMGFDVELGSLLIGNAAVPFLNRLKRKSK